MMEMTFCPCWRRGIRAGKTVVLTTQVQNEGSNVGVYQVGHKIRECPQVLEAFDMTTEAIAGKLMWILGQTRAPETIHRLFYTPRRKRYPQLPHLIRTIQGSPFQGELSAEG